MDSNGDLSTVPMVSSLCYNKSYRPFFVNTEKTGLIGSK